MAKGLYKRGRIWWIRYSLNGKPQNESSLSTKFKDAEELLDIRRQEIRENKIPELRKAIFNYTFVNLSDEYLKWAERQKGYVQKKYVIKLLIVRFGQLLLRAFNTKMLEQYQTERLNDGKKPATVNRAIATIKHMFTKADEWQMVDEFTLKSVRRVKLLQEDNERVRYISKDDCDILIESCDEHLRPIVIMAIHTGMRKSEILSLKWQNVDMKHGFIQLNKTKNGKRRDIPINDTLKEVLDNLIKREDVPYVFYDNISGKNFKDIKRSFKTACRRAGITDFHFHDLRHTCASHMIMAGVELTTVKEILGHKNITMTMRYTHLAPDHKVKAMNILANRLCGNQLVQN